MKESARESLTQWTRLKSTTNTERKQKALADPVSRKLSPMVMVGYFFPRYPSAMDKVSSHFARSPFAHPRAVFFSSSRFSPLPCLSIFQRFSPQSLSFRDRGLCLFCLFFFFFEFSSMFSTPLKKLALPAETNSTFLLIPLLRAA